MKFLTDEQAAAYGRFVEEPTRPELERFFFLDDMEPDCAEQLADMQPC